jgi:hypothetical protein
MVRFVFALEQGADVNQGFSRIARQRRALLMAGFLQPGSLATRKTG